MTGRSQSVNAGPPSPRGLFRSRLRDARIRSKLGLILVIPLIAVMALAAMRLVDSGQRALSADLVQSLTVVSAEASHVAQSLHTERMIAAELLSVPETDPGLFNRQAAETDATVERYLAARAALGAVPDLVEERLSRVDQQLGTLGGVRDRVLTGGSLAAAALQYGGIVGDLVAYQESVAQVGVDAELAESIRAVAALSKARAEMSESAVEAFTALSGGELDEEQLTPFLATLTGRQEALLAFSLAATPEQQALVNAYYTGGIATLADRAERDVIRSARGEVVISPDAAADTLGAIADTVHLAETRLHAEQVALASQKRDTVYQQVLAESVAVVLALVIAIAVAVLLARMLVRSLGQLRENALYVADRELPETVARLSDPATLGENTPDELAARVREPIQLRSRDEIGQVAQAFNAVHRSAVRVAAEQAALRTSVSAMFLNLARRSQTLVDRMISQLDEIERHEEDPKRLSRMFVLDHLATRMRRNDENLLVLAGADSSPPRTDDALVADALRAAQSEVEAYDRIEFGTVDTDVSVVAGSVNDVVRLVAELFDNATRFSPPDSPVVAEARRLGDQVIVQIEDRGLGMSQEQANRINAWLASPPAVEVTTFRRMGLAVVARLAARHQIRVELRCDPNFGTVAYVALPRSILVLPQSRMRSAPVPPPRITAPPELEASAPPPMPARHIGSLPKRSPAVVHHAAGYGANDDTQVDLPVAGRSLYNATTQTAAPPPPPSPAPVATVPPAEATVELPIFREMEAVWFRSHGKLDLGPEAAAHAPSAGSYAPPSQPATPPVAASPRASYQSYQPSSPPPAAPGPRNGPSIPEPREPVGAASATQAAASDEWRTAADSGWLAAAAAAQPTSGGSTKSGLPKRVPQAQLVPGSVDTPSVNTAQRRSPDEIRGLLSAYHRGVQRGRASGAQPH